MSFFKKMFGSDDKEQPKETKLKSKKIIPLKDREKVQILQTVTGKNYKIVRQDGKTGDQIDHYQYYNDLGKGMTEFTEVLWLFDNMVKSRLVNVPDHV